MKNCTVSPAAATIRRRFTTPTSARSSTTGSPTVILAHTVKGYGLGSAEARNATHQEKKLTDQALTAFRSRFEIPVPEMAAKEGVCIVRRMTAPRSSTPGSAVRSLADSC